MKLLKLDFSLRHVFGRVFAANDIIYGSSTRRIIL